MTKKAKVKAAMEAEVAEAAFAMVERAKRYGAHSPPAAPGLQRKLLVERIANNLTSGDLEKSAAVD